MMLNLSTRQSVFLEAMRGQALALDDIAESLEISRPAAQKHLEKLLHAGLAKEDRQEKTAGRPKIVYSLTDKGLELFPRRYSWFTNHFFAALKRDMGADKIIELMRNLARDVGKDSAAQCRGRTLPEKTEAITDIMNEIGYQATANISDNANTNETEISASNCVYHHLAEQHKEICEFDVELIKTLSGAEVELAECMVRGGKLCRFKIRAAKIDLSGKAKP
ncbi:MAG: ArsR family transcriptional regulator [Alphaproteobacteria bacterium]